MSEIPIFTLAIGEATALRAIANCISTNDHVERAGSGSNVKVLAPLLTPRLSVVGTKISWLRRITYFVSFNMSLLHIFTIN